MKVRFKKHIREIAERTMYEGGYRDGHIRVAIMGIPYRMSPYLSADDYEMLLEVLGKTELLNIKAKESLGLFF